MSLNILLIKGLKNNALESIPDEIGNLTKLQWLNVERNKIRELPEEFEHLCVLNYLNMSINKLEKVPPQIFKLKNLNIFLVADNLIKKLNDDEIMGLSVLQKVDFKNNPFLKSMQTNQPDVYKQLISIDNFILNNEN